MTLGKKTPALMKAPSVFPAFNMCKRMWRGGGKPPSIESLHNHPKAMHLCDRIAHTYGVCECACGVIVLRLRKS